MTRPQITLVEFEQIYDEYISLCGNDETMLVNEEVLISAVQQSFFLTFEEKEAILQEDLKRYTASLQQIAAASDSQNDESEEVKERTREHSDSGGNNPDGQHSSSHNDSQRQVNNQSPFSAENSNQW